MSWACRFDVLEQCARRNQPCHPGVQGCVLEGKVVFTRELDWKSRAVRGELESVPVRATKPKARPKPRRPK